MAETPRVAVGVEQPLESKMDIAVVGHACIVVKLGRNPAGVGRNPDGGSADAAADDEAHGLRAVAVRIVRAGMLAVRVVPAVGAAAPLAGEVGMQGVHPGINVGDDDAASGVTL